MNQACSALENTDEELCLLGVNRLGQFIDFVKYRTVGNHLLNDGDIADVWRTAADRYTHLKTLAPAQPRMPEILELPAAVQAHVDQLVKLPQFERVFSTVPIAFGMVELDALIVYQHSITQSTVHALRDSFSKDLMAEQLASICLPLQATKADFVVGKSSKREFIFHSNSHDMRFLGAELVDPSVVPGLVADGFSNAVIALSVGFSNNVLNVVRYQDRMVLNNGYHRCFALRSLGVTHVPCVIQVCRDWEDVGLAGSTEMNQNSDIYFSSQRPPVLQDFFDASLVRSFVTKRQRRQLQIKVDVESLKIGF